MPWQLIPSTRFAEHANAWDALQLATTNTPFLSSAFVAPLLREFGTGKELLALHHNGRAHDAAAIVQPGRRGKWQTFQPSQLPLGPWLAARDDDLAARANSLLRALPGFGLVLGLTQLDPRLQARPAGAAMLGLMDYIDTSYIDVSESFDTYWDSRGKNLRNNTKKQRNKLAGDGLQATLDCVTDPRHVPAAMAEYGRLEAAGWKAEGGTAIDADNAQGRFYSAMLANFCALGQGRIYRYRFGDKVVAMDLCIDNGPLVVVLKTAYDESLRSVSPSTLMRQEQFAAWWAETRFRRIEFYGKTMEWHTRWTDRQRTLYHATMYRWPMLRSAHTRLKAMGARAQTQVAIGEQAAP